MSRKINIIDNTDWITVLIYIALVLFGWINIYAAVYNEEHSSIFDLSMQYGKQMIYIVSAFILAIVIMIIEMNFYNFFAYPIYVIILVLLILVAFLGSKVNGARAWFDLGFFNLQPAEFSKFATSLAIAKYLSGFNVNILRFRDLLKALVIIGTPPLLILLQPDFGSSIVFGCFIFVFFRVGMPRWVLLFCFAVPILFIISIVYKETTVLTILITTAALGYLLITRAWSRGLIFGAIVASLFLVFYFLNKYHVIPLTSFQSLLVATIIAAIIAVIYAIRRRLKYVYITFVLLGSAIVFSNSVEYLFENLMQEHQKNRVLVVLNLKEDPLGVGYNVNQSKIAIGSGGFTGKGFLQGTQTKFKFVPEQSTDFIFCTVGEEWGFLGSFFMICLFLTLLLRLIVIAERQRSVFARIYGYCVITILFFHFAVNISMTIGLFPVVGIPLPFFSYGGSSLIAFTILLFVFLNLDSRRMEVSS